MTVSGKIGFGPEVSGEVVVLGLAGGVSSREVDNKLNGKIIVFTHWVPREVLEKAGLVGVSGLVVPAIHWRDYQNLLATQEYPLVVLGKFGKLDCSKDMVEKLEKFSGKKAVLSGEEKTLSI